MALATRLHRASALLYLIALIVQVYLAGLALSGGASFVPHAILGLSMIVVAILLLVFSFAARVASRSKWLAGGILILTTLQPVLIGLRATSPTIAALHPVAALILFAAVREILRPPRAIPG